jgi:hypothetical protein
LLVAAAISAAEKDEVGDFFRTATFRNILACPCFDTPGDLVCVLISPVADPRWY